MFVTSSPPTMRKAASQEITLAVEVDPKSHAAYLRVAKLKVARTEVLREWPLLSVDRSADGRVVGVESVGGKGFNLLEMLRAAGFRVSATMLGKLNVNVETTEKREMACA